MSAHVAHHAHTKPLSHEEAKIVRVTRGEYKVTKPIVLVMVQIAIIKAYKALTKLHYSHLSNAC